MPIKGEPVKPKKPQPINPIIKNKLPKNQFSNKINKLLPKHDKFPKPAVKLPKKPKTVPIKVPDFPPTLGGVPRKDVNFPPSKPRKNVQPIFPPRGGFPPRSGPFAEPNQYPIRSGRIFHPPADPFFFNNNIAPISGDEMMFGDSFYGLKSEKKR